MPSSAAIGVNLRVTGTRASAKWAHSAIIDTFHDETFIICNESRLIHMWCVHITYGKLSFVGHSSQGGRKYMEDYFSVAYQQSEDEQNLEYAFFGIFDGHGGSEAAHYAKEHLMRLIVQQKLFWSSSDDDVLRAIREGYIACHNAMWREQGEC